MSSNLDQEREPNPASPRSAREVAHHGKGCLAVIIAVAVLVGGGYFAYDQASGFLSSLGEVPDYTGNGKATITVSIPQDATLAAIGDILVKKDVVKSAKAFKRAAKEEPDAAMVQPGSYKMKTQLPATSALKILLDPQSRIVSQVTVREGLRLSQQIDALTKGSKIPRKNFAAVLARPEQLGLPDYARNRPEGFLFPNTYQITPDSTAASVLRAMVKQYKGVAADLDIAGSAKALGLTPYQLVTIASIIEAEVNQDRYRPMVARVILNRLKAGELLRMDSTVHYAEGKNERVTTTDTERASKSPYNTYLHKGLPPGPINSPGKAALAAAAQPADGSWLYFVTVNLDTGETKFATTIDQHNKNVQQFQHWCQAHKGRC